MLSGVKFVRRSTLKSGSFSTLVKVPKKTHPTKKYAYVVYVYVDYRKETGARLMRSYSSREAAIEFAESLSTKYNKKGDEDASVEREYVMLGGTEFDAKLTVDTKKLKKFGVSKQDISDLWYTRIAVDKVEQC